MALSREQQENLHAYNTPYLLEQFYRNATEYGAEALAFMEKEIAARGVSEEERKPYTGEPEKATVRHYSADDFEVFEDTFSQTDLVVVNSILHDAGIVFAVDNPMASSVLPLETEADRRITIHVLASEAARTHELLDQHFHRQDGQYRLRHTDLLDRLRRFGLDELRPTESELEEQIAVGFEPAEVQAVTALGRRLLAEVETIEKDRVIFYFDYLEALLRKLDTGRAGALTKQDLLTVLEVLQIYCDDPAFPQSLLPVAQTLLDVFRA